MYRHSCQVNPMPDAILRASSIVLVLISHSLGILNPVCDVHRVPAAINAALVVLSQALTAAATRAVMMITHSTKLVFQSRILATPSKYTDPLSFPLWEPRGC